MRTRLFSSVFLVAATLVASSQGAVAQSGKSAKLASTRLAMTSTTEATTTATTTTATTTKAAAPRIACSKLNGTVLGLDGKPLVGATVSLKGTPHLYITNSEGRYLVEVPVYQGQVLKVEAAGYVTSEVSLSDCDVPVVGLALAEGTRIKRKGKRAGQITRFGTADMQ